jgi:hypothetical protein
MKNKSLIILLLISTMGLATRLQAQTQVIKANPLALLFGGANVSYERMISDQSSIIGTVGFQYQSFGAEVSTYSLKAGYRYYLKNEDKTPPVGLFINPEVSYGFGKYSFFGSELEMNMITAGAQFGHQWIWDNGFALDLGVGLQYVTIGGDIRGFGPFTKTEGVLPAATAAIGYAF